MTFKVEKSDLKGVLLIQPAVHTDSRGRFFESFQKERYKEIGIEEEFIQDNHSVSQKIPFVASTIELPRSNPNWYG